MLTKIDEMPNTLSRCKCSEVGLAEILEALELLKPKSSQAHALVADALGLGWHRVDERIVIGPEISVQQIAESLNNTESDVTSELKVPMLSQSSGSLIDSSTPILSPDPDVDFSDNKISKTLFNLIPSSTTTLEPTNIALHMVRPRYEPLLCDKWFRSLMGVMLATSRATQEIDLNVLVRELARGQLLDNLPFRRRRTMQRGVLLFLDRSESMQPFWRDEKELLKRLQRFLGKPKVQAWLLEIDRWLPEGSRLQWYSTPPNQLPEKTPLLIVSDFGMSGELAGNQTNLEIWLPLIDLARKNDCPIIALIPAPESHWPKILKQHITYSFVWDRNTSLSTVRQRRHLIG